MRGPTPNEELVLRSIDVWKKAMDQYRPVWPELAINFGVGWAGYITFHNDRMFHDFIWLDDNLDSEEHASQFSKITEVLFIHAARGIGPK